jgi:hypothetical protein
VNKRAGQSTGTRLRQNAESKYIAMTGVTRSWKLNNMKALIIYGDFVSAAKANAALQHSSENVGFAVEWGIIPWRAW